MSNQRNKFFPRELEEALIMETLFQMVLAGGPQRGSPPGFKRFLIEKIARAAQSEFQPRPVNFNVETKPKHKTEPQTAEAPTQPTAPKKVDAIVMLSEKEQAEQAEKLRNLSIERQGTKLIVPDGIDLSTAIKALILKQEEEEQTVSINHTLPIEVAEGMVGFLRVLEREYGFVSNTGSKNWWGGRDQPSYLGIETSPGKRESIPTGSLKIPGISGELSPTFTIQHNRAVFCVKGECKGKDRHKVDRILALVEEECKKNSIYRGHAITTNFPDMTECSSLGDTFPTFSKLNPINPDQVIFSKETEDQVSISLFVPICQTESCRKNAIPLKRGILLEGPYGTGKTLTAAATATLCAQNGWTFIYLKDVLRLAQAYAFALQYQPALIFAEDIDQIINGDDSEKQINQIQNAMDGIESKGIEVITVLTTNYVDKITRAMLRPGRLDTVVSVRAPDNEAAIRLVRMYAGDLLDPNYSLEDSNVGNLLAGEIPALRRESGALTLTPDDIEVTAKSMKAHMNLLKTPEPDTRSNRERAAQIIADGQVRAAALSRSGSQVEEAHHGGNGKSKVSTHESVQE